MQFVGRALVRRHCVEEGQQLAQVADRRTRDVGCRPPRIDQDRAKSASLCTCNVLSWIIPNEYRISSIDIEKRQRVLEDLRRRFPPAHVDAENGGIHGLREAVAAEFLRPSPGWTAPWRVGNDCRSDPLPAYSCKRRERVRIQRAEAEDWPEEDVAHRAQVAIRELLRWEYLEQSAYERSNAIAGILGVQFEGMLERPIAVGNNRLPLREEVTDAVDGLPEDWRKIARPIVRNQRIAKVKQHCSYRVTHWIQRADQRNGRSVGGLRTPR